MNFAKVRSAVSVVGLLLLVLSGPGFAAAPGAAGSASNGTNPADILSNYPQFANKDSVWIVEYESPTDGHILQIFVGPKPLVRSKASSKSGEVDAPSPSDFSDPGPWAGTGVPDNGTVTWSGNWTGGDGTDWTVTVTWQPDGNGGWGVTSFTATQDDSNNDDQPPTEEP